MKKLASILAAAILMTSCADVRTESTDLLHERAVIVTALYSPSEHHTDITQTAYKNGVVGTDFNGNQGIHIGSGMQLTSTTIPEKFGIAFQCQHGTFTIEGKDPKYRVLYKKLVNSVNDTVDIIYKEQYRVTYEKDKKTNQDVVVSRVLNKLDFIDAQLVKK